MKNDASWSACISPSYIIKERELDGGGKIKKTKRGRKKKHETEGGEAVVADTEDASDDYSEEALEENACHSSARRLKKIKRSKLKSKRFCSVLRR